MLRPILRNKNLSSEVNVSKSVGSSAGSRFFCNFCKALSAFFTFLFACRHQKVLKTVHWHSKREVAAMVSARVPATNGLLAALWFETIEVAAACRACSSCSC
nr:hypothetical protein Iba_chr11cCG10990 [Ipomoea batatas]